MAYFTTSIAVVAGLCLAFGILYVFTGVRRPSQRRLNLLFETLRDVEDLPTILSMADSQEGTQ